MTSKFAIHEKCITVITPRTPQVYLIYAFFGNQTTVIKYVAISLIFGCGGCCDIGVDKTLDGAVFKPCGGRAKDKVCGAADITAFEIQAGTGHTSVDGVLMTDKAAVDKQQTIPFCMQCHSLS